jgi:predicted RNase H-like HicB family nuclease
MYASELCFRVISALVLLTVTTLGWRLGSGAGAALCDVASRYAEQMSTLTFNVVYEDAGEGWVYAHVPELPEVHTQGADLDDARATVRNATTLVLDERRARGEAIPSMGWALVEAVEIAA